MQDIIDDIIGGGGDTDTDGSAPSLDELIPGLSAEQGAALTDLLPSLTSEQATALGDVLSNLTPEQTAALGELFQDLSPEALSSLSELLPTLSSDQVAQLGELLPTLTEEQSAALGELLPGIAEAGGLDAVLGENGSNLLDLATSGGSDLISKIGELIGTGFEAFGDFLSAVLDPAAAESLATQLDGLSQIPGMEGLADIAAGLDPSMAGGGDAGGGGGVEPAQLLAEPRHTNLFASAITAGDASGAAMGAATGSSAHGQPGTPGAAGSPGAGAGAGGAAGGHRRPRFLTSTDWMEEALGDTPYRVKPVIEP